MRIFALKALNLYLLGIFPEGGVEAFLLNKLSASGLPDVVKLCNDHNYDLQYSEMLLESLLY